MEKGRKLSLKRKAASLGNGKVKKYVIENVPEPKESDDSDTDVVIVENMEVPAAKMPELKVSSSKDSRCDSSLVKLREMLLSISARDKSFNRTPFPEHIQDSNRFDKDRQPQLPDKVCTDKLSPFPKPCSHLINRKCIGSDQSNTILLNNTDLQSNNAEQVNSGKDKNSVNNKAESESNPLDHANCSIMRDRNSNLYSMQAVNMNTEANSSHFKKEKKHLQPKVSKQMPSSGPQRGLNILSRTENKSIKAQGSSIYGYSDTHPSNTGQTEDQFPVYSGTPKVKSAIDDDISKTESDALSKPVKAYANNSSTSKVNSSSGQEHKFDNSFNQRNSLFVKSVKRTVNNDINFPSTSKSIADMPSHIPCANRASSSTSSILPCTTRDADTSLKQLHMSSRKGKEHDVHGKHSPEPVVLEKCPLCQMEFDKRCDQMEKDSHIAMCLSTAGDDVAW